jgi:hypothetical protein
MRLNPHCDHCFQRDREGPFATISGTARTSFRHVCRLCGQETYLAHTFDEAGNPVLEAPTSGHLYASEAPASECSVCGARGQ